MFWSDECRDGVCCELFFGVAVEELVYFGHQFCHVVAGMVAGDACVVVLPCPFDLVAIRAVRR
jgi:hypothetical protein